jgi:hypothetical protein
MQGSCFGYLQGRLDIGQVIIEALRDQQLSLSLQNEICRNVFAAEWVFARLVWLQVKAAAITDLELKNLFLQVIDSAIREVLRNIPDLAQHKADYFLMAKMFENGERTAEGLTYGPGAPLAIRYQNHVRAIRQQFGPEDLTTHVTKAILNCA